MVVTNPQFEAPPAPPTPKIDEPYAAIVACEKIYTTDTNTTILANVGNNYTIQFPRQPGQMGLPPIIPMGIFVRLLAPRIGNYKIDVWQRVLSWNGTPDGRAIPLSTFDVEVKDETLLSFDMRVLLGPGGFHPSEHRTMREDGADVIIQHEVYVDGIFKSAARLLLAYRFLEAKA